MARARLRLGNRGVGGLQQKTQARLRLLSREELPTGTRARLSLALGGWGATNEGPGQAKAGQLWWRLQTMARARLRLACGGYRQWPGPGQGWPAGEDSVGKGPGQAKVGQWWGATDKCLGQAKAGQRGGTKARAWARLRLASEWGLKQGPGPD